MTWEMLMTSGKWRSIPCDLSFLILWRTFHVHVCGFYNQEGRRTDAGRATHEGRALSSSLLLAAGSLAGRVQAPSPLLRPQAKRLMLS